MSKRAKNQIVRVMREVGFAGSADAAVKAYLKQIQMRPEELPFSPF